MVSLQSLKRGISYAKSWHHSPQLSSSDRRRERHVPRRLQGPARPALFFSQSQHSRLNHRSVRVSRRKEAFRQAGRGHPRHERGFRQGPGAVQAKEKHQFPFAERPGSQDDRRVWCLAEKAIHGQDLHEEHTSELQSPYDLVCRLLLEKKKKE